MESTQQQQQFFVNVYCIVKHRRTLGDRAFIPMRRVLGNMWQCGAMQEVVVYLLLFFYYFLY